MWLLLKEIFAFVFYNKNDSITIDHTMPQNAPETPPEPVAPNVPPPVVTPPQTQPVTPQPYLWDTPENCRHSLRVLCDEEGLTVAQKNLMSQVVHCESGYNPDAIHPNLVDGKVSTTDFGICQWNDWFHWIKDNVHEISPYTALNDPEAAVRLMCKYVKAGRISQWVCFSSGLYEQYQP